MEQRKQKNLKPYLLLIVAYLLALSIVIFLALNWAKGAGFTHEMGNSLLVGLATGFGFGMFGNYMFGAVATWILSLVFGLIFITGIAYHNGAILAAIFSLIYILSFTLSQAVWVCHKELMRR